VYFPGGKITMLPEGAIAEATLAEGRTVPAASLYLDLAPDTLEIVATASDKVQIEGACVQIAQHVSQGGQVSEILSTNEFFPPMMKHMVKAGEATGNVDGMMNKIADFYDVECEATIASLTSLIEPILIVFLGVVVGGIVMAMFLPIFQMGAVAGGVQ
jgi:type IV pilus assembly protein PilC